MVKQNKMISMMIVLVCSINLVHSHFGGPVQVGKCPKIPGVGDGVLMIGHAHKHIVDALNDKNPNTAVKMIYRNDVQSTAENNHATTYKLGFQIETYSGKQFAFLEFESQNNGIGSMRLEKAILTNSLTVVEKCFTLPGFDISNYTPIECGDLKSIFSGYGTDPTAELAYAFAGRNQNSISTQLLSGLSPQANGNRICTTSNYESYNVIGSAADDLSTNVQCNASGLNVALIRATCHELNLKSCTAVPAAAAVTSPSSGDCSGCDTLAFSGCIIDDASGLTATSASVLAPLCQSIVVSKATPGATCVSDCAWDSTVAANVTALPVCTVDSTATAYCLGKLEIVKVLANGNRQSTTFQNSGSTITGTTTLIPIQENGTIVLSGEAIATSATPSYTPSYSFIQSFDKDNNSLGSFSCGTGPNSSNLVTMLSEDFLGLNAITYSTVANTIADDCINTLNAIEYLP